MAKNFPQGNAGESISRTERRRFEEEEKKKSWGKKGGKNCETPMYFISSYIIHFEMHLGWCKSVQRHPLFQAFTLKCLCGWSVLRQFGPTNPPTQALINHYGAEPHLSSWSETSNERRDQDSAQTQKYFIKSTFKTHTLLRMYDHNGELPASHLHHKQQAWAHRLDVRGSGCLSWCYLCLPVWLFLQPTLSALYGALGLFPGSRWLLWGLMTFALML